MCPVCRIHINLRTFSRYRKLVVSYNVKTLRDGWTVVTTDGSLCSHYEHTILITDGEPELLSLPGYHKEEKR